MFTLSKIQRRINWTKRRKRYPVDGAERRSIEDRKIGKERGLGPRMVLVNHHIIGRTIETKKDDRIHNIGKEKMVWPSRPKSEEQ